MIIPLFKPSFGDDEVEAVSEVLRSHWLGLGPKTAEFERRLSDYVGVDYVVALNSCTAALHIALKAMGVKEGDEVLVPAITFVSTAHAVAYCGAKPVFVDINMEDYCMDPKKLETILEKDKYKKIKAAIITDYGGQPAQWEKFFELKKKYKIILINDNCHAIGSNIKKNYGYATKYADFATLSFHPVKAITTGEGGAVLTNNLNYDNKAKLLRSHGMERKNNIYWVYKMNHLGFNFRLNFLSLFSLF